MKTFSHALQKDLLFNTLQEWNYSKVLYISTKCGWCEKIRSRWLLQRTPSRTFPLHCITIFENAYSEKKLHIWKISAGNVFLTKYELVEKQAAFKTWTVRLTRWGFRISLACFKCDLFPQSAISQNLEDVSRFRFSGACINISVGLEASITQNQILFNIHKIRGCQWWSKCSYG